MNKTQKISIAGIGFDLETEAYEKLRDYLDKLERAYAANPDREEIISDVEARIAELILSVQPAEQVVRLSLVAGITERLGEPEPDTENAEGAERVAPDTGPIQRRLYRNPEGAKLGGVCNGLGTFLGVDPVWIRLSVFTPLFLLIILPASGIHFLSGFLGSLFGTVTLMYIIMWIAVPVAKSPRQKLEMRGRDVTTRAIERHIAQEASAMPPETRKSASVMAQLFVVLGKIIVFVLKAVVILVAFAFALGALAVLVSLVALPFAPDMISAESLHLFEGVEGVTPPGYVMMVLGVVLIPMVVIAYQLCRLVFRFRNNTTLMWILCGGWLILFIGTGVVTARNSDRVKQNFEERYNNFGFLLDRANLDRVGTMVIYGDTVLREGEKPRMSELRKLYGKVDTASNFTLEFKRKSGRFDISITAPVDSAGRKTISVGAAFGNKDANDGDNKRK